jgi:hypothetical protein
MKTLSSKMEKEFVPYELALRMKQLGFDEPCFSYYMNGILQPSLNVKDYSYFKEMIEINSNIKNFENVLAPLFQQAFRWFREEHNIHGIIYPYSETVSGKYGWMIWFIGQTKDGHVTEHIKSRPLTSMIDRKKVDDDTYWKPEEAELACLEKLLEIVEGVGS